MNEIGWFFVQNYFAYSLIIFRYYYWKYEEYNRRNNTVTALYVRGYKSFYITFFLFFNSCCWFALDCSSYVIDYNLSEPYKTEYMLSSWDSAQDADVYLSIWPELIGDYKILNYYEYTQGDWGLPWGLKIHRLFIIFWWSILFKNSLLFFKKTFLKFIN